ncbi:MAG: anthranilate synthase component I family protein [Acidobacteriota bacterium]
METAAKTKKVVTPVIETLPADLLTPLAVYLKLAANEENAFLLESVEGGESLARYSFIGAGPVMIVNGDDRKTIISENGSASTVDLPLFEFLRKHFAERYLENSSEIPSFVGGAIGFMNFSCAEWFEPSLARKGQASTDAEASFMIFRSIVAFDHARQSIQIVTLIFEELPIDDQDNKYRVIAEANAINRRLRTILESGEIPLPRPRETTVNRPTSNWSRPDFESAVDEIKELIGAGEAYQVVLSQCFSKQTNATDVGIYRAIRSLNPSPYMFLLKFGERSIIGASPEMLVRSRGRDLEYRPIAGTRKRGNTREQDEQLAEEMRADKKEVAEHMMLVDLGRNDLGRVAEYGSVNVADLISVEKYSHVQHLASKLTAKLREDLDCFDALAACFPAGTVSGAPKVRAIEVIKKLEPTPRGVYAGAVGYFDYSGNMDTCIAIRTLVLEDGKVTIQAGAGIVADSVPSSEFDETVNKAAALIKAVETAEGGRV